MIRSKFIFTFQMGFQIQIQGFGSFLNKLSNQREFERFRKKKDYFSSREVTIYQFSFLFIKSCRISENIRQMQIKFNSKVY